MLAHFDHWQRSGEDRQYEAQDQWPEELRRARLIPAVDYLQVLQTTYCILVLLLSVVCKP